MTHGDLEAEGPPSSSGKETWGRETPAAPGISEPAGGSTQGVPGPSLSGLLDPRADAGRWVFWLPLPCQLAPMPTCATLPTISHSPGPGPAPGWNVTANTVSSRGCWCVRSAQAHGRKGQHGPPTMTVTTDESTKAAQGGQRPPQGDTPWWYPGPPPRSVQPPQVKGSQTLWPGPGLEAEGRAAWASGPWGSGSWGRGRPGIHGCPCHPGN